MNQHNDLIQSLVDIHQRPLEDHEIAEVEQWQRGQKLRNLINTEEWEIVKDTLRNYAVNAVDELLGLAPGSPEVTTAHAAASALTQQNKLFIEDVEAAVEASYRVPEIMKRTISKSIE